MSKEASYRTFTTHRRAKMNRVRDLRRTGLTNAEVAKETGYALGDVQSMASDLITLGEIVDGRRDIRSYRQR